MTADIVKDDGWFVELKTHLPHHHGHHQQVDGKQQRFEVPYRRLRGRRHTGGRDVNTWKQSNLTRNLVCAQKPALCGPKLTSNSMKSNSAAQVYISVWKSL